MRTDAPELGLQCSMLRLTLQVFLDDLRTVLSLGELLECLTQHSPQARTLVLIDR
jgi:hypothetical protein